jgi:hypothetical protein
MTVMAEGDLQITLPAGVTARKFDDEVSHGLSHCMKAVDFIVEEEYRILFVEFKDPEHPTAQPKEQKQFLKKLLSGALDTDLKTKYRDSFLYEWASGQTSKPIYYLVLIGASSLSEAELLTRTDALKRAIPVEGFGNKPWKRPFVAGCAVLNIAAWNKALPTYPVCRISA